jgi:hypothetical protein
MIPKSALPPIQMNLMTHQWAAVAELLSFDDLLKGNRVMKLTADPRDPLYEDGPGEPDPEDDPGTDTIDEDSDF